MSIFSMGLDYCELFSISIILNFLGFRMVIASDLYVERGFASE